MIRQPIVTVCGHVDHGKCVSEDTVIPLVDGTLRTAKALFEENYDETKAEKIDDGMLQDVREKSIIVNSFDGKNIVSKPISHIWKRKSDNLIEIRTASGDIIKTTPEHPFYTFSLERPKETRADSIKEGEYIAIPKKIETIDLNLEEYLVKKIKNLPNFVCFLNSNSAILIDKFKDKNISEFERNLKQKNLRDCLKKLRFRIIDFFKICAHFNITDREAYSMIESVKNANEGQRKGHTSNKIFLPKRGYEEKLGYVLGVLAGDGHISKRAVLNNNDLEINNEYSSCLSQIFGLKSQVKQAHTCKIVIDSGGLTFARFLFEVIGFPKKNKSADIFVPEIAKQNKEIFRGFFSGLFDTDGYVSHINHCIEITSKSKKMIKECSILLLNYGIHSAIYEKNGFGVLRIANKIYLELFMHFFNPRLNRKKERVIDSIEKAQSSRLFDFFPIKGNILKELKVSGKINKNVPYFNKYQGVGSLSSLFLKQILKNLKQENNTSALLKQLIEQEISYVKVTSKKEVQNQHGWVYDFTVPDTHNFIAERVLVHNTSLLDKIRQSSVAAAEAGGITQKISFTLFPAENIKKGCALIDKHGYKLEIPGFLFIDTPGHAAFTNLRKRGGSLADLAILVIDINDGIKPQTSEVLQILKANKTPFIIALNKIDSISGWKKHDDLKESVESQAMIAKNDFEEKLYTFQAALNSYGFNSDLFFNVTDFTKKIALVPCSAKSGEGISELLMMLCGLSQKFLKDRLSLGERAKGIILEVKKEKTMSIIEAIIYDGTLKVGDEILIASFGNSIKTKIRGLEEIKPLSSSFKPTKEVTAATGIRVQLAEKVDILPGMPFQVYQDNIQEIEKEFKKELSESIKLDPEGIVIKADSLGSLEALLTLLRQENIQVIKAGIGSISKQDLMAAKANCEIHELCSCILGFNVPIDEDVQDKSVKIILNEVVYRLIEEFKKWQEDKKNEIEKEKLMGLATVCKVEILQQYVFHNSKPAIFGVKVIGGKLKSEVNLISRSGEEIGRVKNIQAESSSLKEATEGMEIAISLPGVTFDRQLKDQQFLYSDLGETQFRAFKKNKDILNAGELRVLQEIAEIKRKEKPTWGV